MNMKVENKCILCGSEMTPHRENHALKALPGTVLRDIIVWRCEECGEYEIEIPRLDALLHTVAAMVIERASRLTADEVIFLRDFLGFTQTQLAARLGVAPETLSRYEHGELMGRQTDRLLRMIVAHEIRAEGMADMLADVANDAPEAWRAKIVFKGERWEPAV